jgi:hypothetical protein
MMDIKICMEDDARLRVFAPNVIMGGSSRLEEYL